MRAFLIIVMFLSSLVATSMGLMIGYENLLSEDADKLNKLVELTSSSKFTATAEAYRYAGQGGFVVGLLALVMAIVTFTKKTKAIRVVASITMLTSIVMLALSSGTQGAANQAMVFCIAAMIVTACGFGAEQIRLKKAD